MSVEDMTQQEWDEHREQLEKHLAGVENRHIARLGVAMGFDRKWVGLTDEDLSVCKGDEAQVLLARYWEAKLRKKNTYL